MVDDVVVEYAFNGKRYSLPDSDILERNFVAIPLAEIAPYVLHPVTKQTFVEIAKQFSSDGLNLVE